MKKIKTGAYAALLVTTAVLIVAAAKPQSSSAYFTAYDTAAGSVTLNYSYGNELHEDVDGLEKEITVKNTGENEAFARVKILLGSQIKYTIDGEDWYLSSDGYIYYNKVLAAGETTAVLKVTLTPAEGFNSDFSVVVAEETVPVQYDNDGAPYADWEMRMNIV